MIVAISNRASPRHDATSPAARSDDSSRPPSRSGQPNLNPSPRKSRARTPPSPTSASQSRAASPLRFFGWNLHRNHSRDEPFIPVDPFQFHIHFFASPTSTPRRSSLPLPNTQVFFSLLMSRTKELKRYTSIRLFSQTRNRHFQTDEHIRSRTEANSVDVVLVLGGKVSASPKYPL